MQNASGTRQVVIQCRLCPKTFIADDKMAIPPSHTNGKGNFCFGSYDPGEFKCYADEYPKPGVARPENIEVHV